MDWGLLYYKVLREIGSQWWYHLLLFFLVFLPKNCIVYDKLVTEIVFLKYMDFFSRRISTSKVTVLGYGLLTTDAETLIDALNTQNFSVVIVDESHYMKSRNATRSKILLPIVQRAKRAILLTGTPALGRPEEVLKSLYVGLKNKQKQPRKQNQSPVKCQIRCLRCQRALWEFLDCS